MTISIALIFRRLAPSLITFFLSALTVMHAGQS